MLLHHLLAFTVTFITWLSALPSSSVIVTVKAVTSIEVRIWCITPRSSSCIYSCTPFVPSAVTVKFGFDAPSFVSVNCKVPVIFPSSSFPLAFKFPVNDPASFTGLYSDAYITWLSALPSSSVIVTVNAVTSIEVRIWCINPLSTACIDSCTSVSSICTDCKVIC